jgi:protocatechuate 3,4-dioxygenase beta subunit
MQRSFVLLAISAVISLAGCSQNDSKKTANKSNEQKEIKVGGGCEGCEAIYESYVSFDKLSYTDTLPDFNEQGPKIEISGIVYQSDGKTPAPGIILYVYHTDQAGLYSKKGNETGWGKRHGYIRGWMKTNEQGQYKFYTLVPASYPNSTNPKHIHPTIKEPGKTEYWIDEFVFDDDPLLPDKERNRTNPVGGNGVLKTVMKDGMLRASRNIILGLNVADYPKASVTNIQSGLVIGSNCPAFDPMHVSGADIGKKTCPMCKYGYGQGIMVWFNHTNLDNMSQFTRNLESEMERRGEKKFRVFLVYMNPSDKKMDMDEKKIRQWCEEQHLEKVAMVYIPSPTDEKTAGVYKINPAAKNTVFIYKQRKIAAKWVNIEYDDESLNAIMKKFDTPTL